MNINEEILRLIQDAFPFDEENAQEYYDGTFDLHTKIVSMLPVKQGIVKETVIHPNKPLWLWHKGSKEPVLANFRTEYPEPCFWPIVDGDYINNSNAIPFDRATHFMYVNDPDS